MSGKNKQSARMRWWWLASGTLAGSLTGMIAGVMFGSTGSTTVPMFVRGEAFLAAIGGGMGFAGGLLMASLEPFVRTAGWRFGVALVLGLGLTAILSLTPLLGSIDYLFFLGPFAVVAVLMAWAIVETARSSER